MNPRITLTVFLYKPFAPKPFGFAKSNSGESFYFPEHVIRDAGVDWVEVGDTIEVSFREAESANLDPMVTIVHALAPKGRPSLEHIGTVNWYSTKKGYGFIGVVGEPDVFVHANALRRSRLGTLADGARVRFCTQVSRNGKMEVNFLEVVAAEAVVTEEAAELGEVQLEFELAVPTRVDDKPVEVSNRRRRRRLSRGGRKTVEPETTADEAIAA